MPRQTINDLVAFLAVARERSFTRAAARIGVSPSALSHTIRALEQLTVRVDGQLTVNDIALARAGTGDGLGIAYLPEDYMSAPRSPPGG